VTVAPTDAGEPDADAPDVDVDANVQDADVADAAPDADVPPNSELRLVCWGANESGQLARDASSDHAPPAFTVGAQGPNSTLVVGGRVTCVLDEGELRCAGANEQGQLGLGVADPDPHGAFTPVTGIDLPVVGASLGARHGCALLQTIPGIAQVACWGDNSQGQLGDGIGLGAGYADAATADRYRRTRPVFVLPAD
jgi:hypothetical protein